MKNDFENKLKTRQFRDMKPLETRNEEENSYIVEGYRMKYEPYVFYEDGEGKVYEEFKREAFNKADVSDVIFLYDHQGKVLARNSNNTLKITFDDIGMYIEADLSTSKASREMYEEIKSGLVNKMSWSFNPGIRGRNYDFNEETRTLVYENIPKIYDVSAVGIPANNDTNINARNFVDGVIDEVRTERFKEQRQKDLLKLQIELLKEK